MLRLATNPPAPRPYTGNGPGGLGPDGGAAPAPVWRNSGLPSEATVVEPESWRILSTGITSTRPAIAAAAGAARAGWVMESGRAPVTSTFSVTGRAFGGGGGGTGAMRGKGRFTGADRDGAGTGGGAGKTMAAGAGFLVAAPGSKARCFPGSAESGASTLCRPISAMRVGFRQSRNCHATYPPTVRKQATAAMPTAWPQSHRSSGRSRGRRLAGENACPTRLGRGPSSSAARSRARAAGSSSSSRSGCSFARASNNS